MMKNSNSIMTVVILVLFTAIAFTQEVPMERKESKQHAMDGSSMSSHNVRDYMYKPRIINTTDLGADPDDEQSMVRQLVCANEVDIEGLIVATGCWKKSQSNTVMLDKILNAYGQGVSNLSVHAEGYPALEYFLSISVVRQRGYGMGDVGTGKDSPGSELIIASVDKDHPHPVWVTCWGGQFKRDGNTNHYVDGPGRSSISKWRSDYQAEFAERADWCISHP